MSISKEVFSPFIKEFRFRELFNEMGWDNTRVNQKVSVDEDQFQLEGVAVKSGFIVLVCKTNPEDFPKKAIRRQIHKIIAKLFFEHLIIYCDTNKSRQIWQTAIRLPNSPIKVHEVVWSSEQDPEILYQRASGLFFAMAEEGIITIVDVIDRINKNFNQNSETVTKKFYEEFNKHHINFSKLIEGIENDVDRRWYSSLMLNRLMFIYFIQKKGFLDGDIDYLSNKLKLVKQARGKDKFFKSFYRTFLLRLFHEGLGKPHDKDIDLIKLIGKVPYLNGGIFDIHELERDHESIDIPDRAFEKLFAFFNEYYWHLDESVTSSGKDINPDVIGYIFEKYINDRAQMGAYYTKEDITEYISKNTIIPFLFDRAKENCSNAFQPGSSLWQLMKQDPDRYIYEAVRHGVIFEKGLRYNLPADILAGLDAPDNLLVEKRKAWNREAPSEIALPTESYREVIERRKRYFEIRDKIEKGQISEINDFITYNLNIRQFAQDAVDSYEGSDFIQAIFETILGRKYDDKHSNQRVTSGITILDPTCGSGAFLFAALNILKPLYEACINRMREFVEEDDRHNGKRFRQFRIVLDEISQHPSEAYYIIKSIILNNLYGVDIMKEAVETAKLRLFLKLIAEVEDIEHVEPLPDIDFNIRCGNTLVGYAAKDEIEYLQGMWVTLQMKEKILEECNVVAMSFKHFKEKQLTGYGNITEFTDAKMELNCRLKKLAESLNQILHKQYYQGTDYKEWKNLYQPFHWFTEFYEIIYNNGGFDCVIGNPPYVVYTKKDKKTHISISDIYKLENYITLPSNNLFSFIIERSIKISTSDTKIGMIIPISSISSNQFGPLQKILSENLLIWQSSFSNRPAKLFENVEQRLTIFISQKAQNDINEYYASSYKHWYSSTREYLFTNLIFEKNSLSKSEISFSKVGSQMERKIKEKIFQFPSLKVSNYLTVNSVYRTFYHNGPTYFIRAMSFMPNKGEDMCPSTHYKFLTTKEEFKNALPCILNSSIFYFFYKNYSNCRDFSDREINALPLGKLDESSINKLDLLEIELRNSYQKNKEIKSRKYESGQVYYEEYYPAKSKYIIDKIDAVLANHYKFTIEELDYIINYDIKYRIGSENDSYASDED